MAKNIKKSYKFLIVVAGIIVILPTMLFFFVRLPGVQTLLIRRVTSHLSEKVNSTISIGKMEFQFFNKLNMSELLIKDWNGDTLLYAGNTTIGIRRLDIKNNSISFGKITVTNPVFSLINDTAGKMNLMWYLDLLGTSKDTSGRAKTTVKISQIDVINGRFSLINMEERNKKESKVPVNFSDLRLSGINGTMEDFIFRDDTTRFNVNDLVFHESQGFDVRKMKCAMVFTENDIQFNSALITTDSSIINAQQVRFRGDSATRFSNFMEDVRLDIILDRSQISASDLKFFAPLGNEVNASVWMSGKVTGTVSELRGRNIDISYGEYTTLNCDFDLSGLPEFKSSFIYIGINHLRTNALDIAKLKIPGRPKLNLPELFYTLGNVSLDGSFTGFTADFVAYGNIRTKFGTISTDISFRPEEKNRFKVNGFVRGISIALGQLTENPDMLGNISMKADIDGYAYSLKKFSGKLTGIIDSVEVNNYKYRNISLNGIFSENTWDGDVKINDKNIKFDFLGMLDFSRELPEFDFTLNLDRANLYNLHFDKADTSSALSMLLTANFKGSKIDNLDGEIKLLNSTLRKYGNPLDLYDFSIRTFNENGKPAISLRTDYVDADLRGYYNFAGLQTAFKSVLSSMMPSRFPAPPEDSKTDENNFTFNIGLKNTDRISTFFRTGLLISEKSIISGTVISDSILSLTVDAKSLSYKGLIFKDLNIDANYRSPEFKMNISSSSLNILGQSELKGFNSGLNTTPDKFDFGLNWDNQDAIRNHGSFRASGNFEMNPVPGGIGMLSINIDSTSIFSRDKIWRISPSSIKIDTTSLSINKLYISNMDNYYMVDGTVSGNNADTLYLEFKGIDIGWLNALASKNKKSDQISLAFKGKLNGNVLLSDLYNNPLLETNLKIDGFSMLQSEYGDLSVISVWNNKKKLADVTAFNNLNGNKMLDITGYYDPASKMLNLTGVADHLPVDALNPLLSVFASGITGTTSGKINLAGQTNKLVLKGALLAENTSLKIDYLQTRFRLNDSIRFEKDKIVFRNVRMTDDRGNPATLAGSVNHRYFKDYSANLMITTNETMVLNTRPKDNDMFYGTAYATGVTTINSSPGVLSFDISARTGKNTKFFIPLNSSETISENSFITFVNHDSTLNLLKITDKTLPATPSTELVLNIDLEITPEAEVQLIFDPKVGDIMKGHGSGDLNIRLDRKGGFRISGDYIIEDGDYLFTLGNLLNKSFSVEDGGRISFNGDIGNAELDIKAIYKLKASLYDILKDETFSEKIPVECQIYLTGKLVNPVVALEIVLPTADEATRTYLQNVITTEEEKSRQFLYLLVMNSFYSDPSVGNTTSTTTTGTSAMAVTTTEMLSNQFSNWLSQISNDFDLGVTYRPGQKDFNDQEVQVALSTQLLDDRVVINGNLDVRGVNGLSDNTDQLTGDFDIEYKPKFSDKIRFKVFNRYNNPYDGKQAPYTQGFGIFFRQDFNKFSDLFKKKNKKKDNAEMKKEEEAVVKEK